MSTLVQRVFVSSTSEDLPGYRRVVRDALLAMHWQPIMMEHFGASTEHTVEACCHRVLEADLVLLLVAFRRGWVPGPEQGGDGVRSITAYELDTARRKQMPVRMLLANGKNWPGALYEWDSDARAWLQDFRARLDQPAKIFDFEPELANAVDPLPRFRGAVDSILLDHSRWLMDWRGDAPPPARAPVGAEQFRPGLETHLPGLVLHRTELLELHRRCAPAGWEPLPLAEHPTALLVNAVRNLAPAPRQEETKTFPLLSFVELLRSQVDPNRADALRVWLTQARQKLEPDPKQELPPAPPPKVTTAGHLLIKIDSRVNPGTYSVMAWLVGSDRSECLRAGEEEVRREDLPGYIGQLLQDLDNYDLAADQSWIEFFLPRELLNSDVDQWKMEQPLSAALPLGADRRVSVRSLDRVRVRSALLALRKRWEVLQKRSGPECCIRDAHQELDEPGAAAIWIDHDECDAAALLVRLRDAAGVVCALLGRAPRATPDQRERDALGALLQAGIPVLLWARCCPPVEPHSIRPELGQLLADAALANLPDQVWKRRKQAVWRRETTSLYQHLTLLWDDPTRIPPDMDPRNQLRAPGR
jgi:hypothetical protein